MIYKGKEINCTKKELEEFIGTIPVSYEVRSFAEKYNNVEIENKTGNSNAKYYVLVVGDTTYLQPHDPFSGGFVAITENNAIEIIEKYKQQALDDIIFSNFRKTKESLQDERLSKIEEENLFLGQTVADLELQILNMGGSINV